MRLLAHALLSWRPTFAERSGLRGFMPCHVRVGTSRQDARQGIRRDGSWVGDPRLAWTALGGGLALTVALWWLIPAPTTRPVAPPSMRIHVEEIVPTDASFREPTRAFSGGVAYWRVVIRDAREEPVPDARVHVDVVDTDGGVRARLMMITNGNGLARFTYPLVSLRSGVYTVRVVDVAHLDRSDAAYDRAANTGASNSFSVP